MKSQKTTLIAFALSILVTAIFIGCNKDDEDKSPQPTGEEKTYELSAVGTSSVSGTALFEEMDDESVRITLTLTGTSSDGDHPTHIHANSAAEGGGIVVNLTNVDGSTGISETIVTELEDGTPISYESLIAFDGYINVHDSQDNLGNLLAQGDIGSNVLTGESEEYAMSAVGNSGVSGSVTFSERLSGETLVVIELTGDPEDSDHPTHIHTGTAASPGGIVVHLSNVMDGFSRTNVSEFSDGTAVTYDELIAYAGYINVHNAEGDLGTLVAQGDIGSNKLTGESEAYEISEVTGSGISGTVTFNERINGHTLVVISLTGDASDSNRPTHIHTGSTVNPGGIAIHLTNVKNGSSKTNITEFNDGTAVTYDELIAYEGYVNVHNAEGDLATLVAQGNIGASVGAGDVTNYDVTNSGATAYLFTGNGLTNSSNPNITLQRGKTYTFTIDAPGHPFWINSSQGTGSGNAYSSGVTGNGASSGTITFVVPGDAPAKLFYNCEFHASMTGEFNIID